MRPPMSSSTRNWNWYLQFLGQSHPSNPTPLRLHYRSELYIAQEAALCMTGPDAPALDGHLSLVSVLVIITWAFCLKCSIWYDARVTIRSGLYLSCRNRIQQFPSK